MLLKLTIAIVTWNSVADVRECLQALYGADEFSSDWEVWVADNASTDDTAAVVRSEFPQVKIIANRENVGFARANNQIFERTHSDYVLLLNPDTVATPQAISVALEEIERYPRAGMLGIQLRNTDGTLQESCFRFPTPLINFLNLSGLHLALPRTYRATHLLERFWKHDEARTVDWILGAFMLVRRTVINEIGGVPEDYWMFQEDVDWCYRAWQAGYEVRFTPRAQIVHHGNRSGSQLPSLFRVEHIHRARYEFCRRYYGEAAMRFMQLTDAVGFSLRRLRYRYDASTRVAARRADRELARLGSMVAWRELRRPTPRG